MENEKMPTKELNDQELQKVTGGGGEEDYQIIAGNNHCSPIICPDGEQFDKKLCLCVKK